MDEGVSVSDENGIILLTNPAEDAMFGYDAEELIGKHVMVQNAYEPEENARIVNDVIIELKQKGFWTGEWRNRKKDGTDFYTHSFITSLIINEKTFFVCVQRDITWEKNDKEKLAYRTALLEAQNEAIPDAILVVDMKGNMLSFNQHFVTLWKIPVDIINRKDDAAALQFAMTQLVDPEEFIEQVNYYYNHPTKKAREEIYFKDGRIIERYGNAVAGTEGKLYGWAWYFRDITERKKIEQDLKKTKEQLELTFKNIPAGIYLINHKGEIIYVNEKGAKVYGDFTPEDLLAEKNLPALF
jgi:PAS domain S-box-containing protein